MASIPGLSHQARRIAVSNTKEVVLPSRQHYIERATKDILSFLHLNHVSLGVIGGPKEIRKVVLEFCNRSWETFQQSPHDSIGEPRAVQAGCDELQEVVKGAIWHCEDHKASRLVAYCPVLYAEIIKRTFFDEHDVFREEATTPWEANAALKAALPKGLQQSSRWAFPKLCKEVALPKAYQLPKRKKEWLVGRTIIPFANFFLQGLHRACGRVLGEMMKEVVSSYSFNLV